MRGLDRLQAIRRSGKRPEGLVKLSTDPFDRDYEGYVVIDAGDAPERADLRVFTRLSVVVVGREFKTIDNWAKAVAAAGATNVAIVMDDGEVSEMAILKHNGEMLA